MLHFCIMLYSTYLTNSRVWSDLPHTATKAGKVNDSSSVPFMEENTFNCADKHLRLYRNSELNHVKFKLPKLKKNAC